MEYMIMKYLWLWKHGKENGIRTKRNNVKLNETVVRPTLLVKLVAEKTFSNPPCGCKMRCSDNVSEEQRKKLFDNFYSMGSFQIQNAYIYGLCKQCTSKAHRARDGSRGMKSSTTIYHLQLSETNLKVCKQFFLKAFQISDGRCFRVLKKIRDGCVFKF